MGGWASGEDSKKGVSSGSARENANALVLMMSGLVGSESVHDTEPRARIRGGDGLHKELRASLLSRK